VGDPYQLPPIGFGLVFQVLAASPHIPKVDLVEVHRQAQSSGIPQAAREIRHGIVPSLPAFAGLSAGVSFIEADDGDVMDYLLGVLTVWRGCEDKQVLGVTKRGASGTRNINATLHAMASAAKPKLEGWAFAEGDPIIYLMNDYQKELWNGSLGRIESILSSNGRRSLVCCLDGERQEIPEEDFHRIDLAYAITVHKAQGSQFKRVIVPIVKTRLLDRTQIIPFQTAPGFGLSSGHPGAGAPGSSGNSGSVSASKSSNSRFNWFGSTLFPPHGRRFNRQFQPCLCQLRQDVGQGRGGGDLRVFHSPSQVRKVHTEKLPRVRYHTHGRHVEGRFLWLIGNQSDAGGQTGLYFLEWRGFTRHFTQQRRQSVTIGPRARQDGALRVRGAILRQWEQDVIPFQL
jgi:hypothetical protein